MTGRAPRNIKISRIGSPRILKIWLIGTHRKIIIWLEGPLVMVCKHKMSGFHCMILGFLLSQILHTPETLNSYIELYNQQPFFTNYHRSFVNFSKLHQCARIFSFVNFTKLHHCERIFSFVNFTKLHHCARIFSFFNDAQI